MAKLTARGYRGPGGGSVALVDPPQEWRATSVQVCGLWPFVAGSGAPTVGVPLGFRGRGRNRRAMCFDPLSWFSRAHILLNPSMFTLGLPALGKSTLHRRLMIGFVAQGVIPMVLGDLKPDYADVVTALGGQRRRIGRGLGSVNPLDVTVLLDAARQLQAAGRRDVAEELREEALGRQLTIVKALIAIVRHTSTRDFEDTVLAAALRVLAVRWRRRRGAPLLGDLNAIIEEGPEEVRAVTLARGNAGEYLATVKDLQRSLLALIDGPLGSVFARPTTERITLSSTAVDLDVSAISRGDKELQAAALVACWSEGFATVEAANALADAGLAAQRRYFLILDELWRVLTAGAGLVQTVDGITRLNRNDGVGQGMVTHSTGDLRSIASPAERERAEGFVERAGAIVCGGLPPREMDELARIVHFSQAERQLVSSWSTPPGWSENAAPPGLGKFLLKVGSAPGIPFDLVLTSKELGGMNNTNKRW